MNAISKTMTITATVLLIASGQNAFAESIGKSALDATTKDSENPAFRLVVTPNFEAPKRTVIYTSQDLESEEGVRKLYGSLQRASKEVCGAGTAQHDGVVIMKSARLRCYRQALSDAVNEIDNQDLTRFHTG